MYAPLRYSLLVESVSWIENRPLQDKITLALSSTHSWVEDETHVHSELCSGVGQPHQLSVSYSLEEAWDRRCSRCPSPLTMFLSKEEVSLVETFMEMAWTLGMPKTNFWAHAALAQGVVLEEACSGGALHQALKLWKRVLHNYQYTLDRALENPHEALRREAALYRTESTMPAPPPSHPEVTHQQWWQLQTYWRYVTTDPRITPQDHGWEERLPEDHEELSAVLDAQFTKLLTQADSRPVLVGVHAGELRHYVGIYEALLRHLGELHQEHLYVQVSSLVQERLQQVSGAATNLGETHPEDTPAILETTRCLHRDNFQPGAGSDILGAARLLNT